MTWRYDCPHGSFGVMYLGRGQIGPFAETLLRDPTQREILWSAVQRRGQAEFRTMRPLNLVSLHGEGCGWFGVTSDQIMAPHDPGAECYGYEVTQRLSARIHAEWPDADGIQYRSRYNNDELCVALFERAAGSVDLICEGREISRQWARSTLEVCGFELIDL